MDMHLDGYRLSRDLIISYLYDPILDKARKRKIIESQKIIDNLNYNKDIISQIESLDKCNEFKVGDHIIQIEDNKKQQKAFKKKVNSDIKRYLNNLCTKNILRKEYIEHRTKSQKMAVYFDVKENKEIKFINVSIEKDNNVTYQRIPEIIENNLKNAGYKVGMTSVKNVINDK